MYVVRGEGLWKIYNEGTPAEVQAIKNVDIKIKKGEFVGLTGASGSGKSTLMDLIGCLSTPTRGKIYIEDEDVSELSSNELAEIRREKIGFVFQTFNLIGSLTAQQNVELPMIFAGYDKASREERAKSLLKRVGLGERLDHRPGELSGGECQRVAIARALANNPKIVLADEPTGNLDSKSGKEIMKIFKELNEEGITLVVVSHDANIIRNAERVIHLKDGRIEREERR
jgi:putative ABC transport system ATP-binding protein